MNKTLDEEVDVQIHITDKNGKLFTLGVKIEKNRFRQAKAPVLLDQFFRTARRSVEEKLMELIDE